MNPDLVDLEHQFIRTNGVTLHTVLAGPVDGPPVVLLHGFPEFWYGWRHQIPDLAAAGYRVIVPDQRGYNLSSKPRGVAAYHLDQLALDIAGLLDALEYEDSFVVGHDWGAAVAWWLSYRHPQRLRKVSMLNVPFPTILFDAIRGGNWKQLRKSWYILAFQLPWLAEAGFRNVNQGERNLLKLTSRKDTFMAEELERYEEAWARPGAVTGMLNWYRAAARYALGAPRPEPGALPVPTLLLWGERDSALGKELAQPSIELCRDGRLRFFPKATHWLQHDEPQAVNEQLIAFLG
jgi:pimeloyl-ACP methyl ester carboxylesterase